MIKKYYFFQPAKETRKTPQTARLFLFTGAFLAFIVFMTYRGVYAIFSGTANSLGNTFTAAFDFGDPEATPAPKTVAFSLERLSNAPLAVGDEFDVDLIIDPQTLPVSAVEAVVNFPTTDLEFISFTPSSFLPTQLTSPDVSEANANGVIRITRGIAIGDPKTNPGSIGILKFRADHNGMKLLIWFDALDTEAVAIGHVGNLAGLMTPLPIDVADSITGSAN